MKNEIVKQAMAVMDTAEYGSEAFECAAYAAWHAMTGAQREVLFQLPFRGPVFDGDVCSKSARDDLIAWGLAVRCCFKGEQGHTAAAYRAFTIFQRSGEEKPKPRLATKNGDAFRGELANG